MKVIAGLLILGMACLANAQLKSPGTCPTFRVQKNFDVAKYMGRWFEQSKYVNDFQKGQTCPSADYTDITKSGGPVVIDVLNRAKEAGKEELGKATGNATLGDPDNAEKPAKLVVNFYGERKSDRISTTTNYNVIETDYTSYSIIYFCRQAGAEKSEFLWLVTRQRDAPMTLINAMTKKVQDEGIDVTRLTKQIQTDCPELPNSSASVSSSMGFLAAMLIVRNFF